MRGWLRTLGVLLLPGLVLGLALLSGAQQASRPFGQYTAEDGSQEVQGHTTVGQTFIAPFDGLYRVDLFVGTGGRVNTKDLVLHLRATPDAKEDLRSDTLHASSVTSDGWVVFEFPRVADSGGHSYYLLLESQSSKPGDSLSVFRSLEDRYRDGTYYLDGVPAGGDLAFSFQSRTGLIGWLRGVVQLLAKGKPSFWGQPACYGALAILYVVLFLVLARWQLPFGLDDESDPTTASRGAEPER